MNNDHHGLSRGELEVLMYQLFSEYALVAKTEKRGFFSPTFAEIQSAFDENWEEKEQNTFYGMTTGALDEYRELKDLYYTENKR